MRNYQIVIFSTLISLFFAFSVHSQNQKRVIFGEVLTMNELPVANFKVEARKSGAGAITDSLGYFTIVTEPRDVLRFRSKVFRNERVRIRKETPDSIRVHVEFIPTQRNKELAVGYGFVSEDELLNAVSHMDQNQVDFCNYSNMYELIRGRFAGVQVRGNEIIIRGSSSINLSDAALLVVDGNVVSSISHISPCDVSDINVIKDSGASIYGSRGANGVVIIETRKGSD